MTVDEKFDVVSAIIEYEDGTMNDIHIIAELFQHLVDTGMINNLQGSYQRTAQLLLEHGVITNDNR